MNEIYFLRKRLVNQLMNFRDLRSNPILKVNEKFKNVHTKDRCYILGSGPSIKTQDLTGLRNEIVMTQNHFHSHKDIDLLNPAYHVVVPKFHPKEYENDWISWIKGMEDKLPKTTDFFLGLNTKPLIEQQTGLADRSYYISPGNHSVVMKNAKVDLTKTIMNIPTVITQCISIALYMGFKEIYLSGFDLDQIFQLSKGMEQVRFYGHSEITKNKAELDSVNNATKDGFHFFNYWLIWKQLILLKKYADERGVKIINVTEGGILDVFPRQSLLDSLKA
jgi:hypothetical protein